jgi:geranylgeranyl diphosphate synthase, type I
LKLLSADQLQLIDIHLCGLLERIFHAEGLSALNRAISQYVLGGGKRLRPQLCLWTFGQCISKPPGGGGSAAPAGREAPALPHFESGVLDLGCAWEIFHAFLLAHDDIIDDAALRRDRPTLHRQLAGLDGHSARFGTHLGIIAGDLLFSGAMRVFHELECPAEMYRRQVRLFSRIACLTGFGQAIDICQSHAPIDTVSEELLLREYHWKTAAYTFEGPMLSGAIAAGVDEAAHEPISQFALAMGQAYQLQNDLLDLQQAAHPGCDLAQGKRTISLLRARAAMNDARREKFDRRLDQLQHGNGRTVALAESIRQELCESGAVAQTRRVVEQYLDRARSSSNHSALPPVLRAGMGGLLKSIEKQYFLL